MVRINRHIEIARSSIAALSSLSLASAHAIQELLAQHYTTVGISTVDNLNDLRLLVAKNPDLVFMGLKYVPNELDKIWVSSYLEERDIAHTGSPKIAIEFEQSKPLAKQRVLDAGLKTAPYLSVGRGQQLTASDIPLRFPVFAKPSNLGGGDGSTSIQLPMI